VSHPVPCHLSLLIRCSKKLEWSKLILNVDLWDAHGTHAENCVRHGAPNSAISSANTVAYPIPTLPMSGRREPLAHFDIAAQAVYQRAHMVGTRAYLEDTGNLNAPEYSPQGTEPSPDLHHHSSQELASPGPRMEPSKNLIGQCHTSLQQLEGLDGQPGLFFIFQDLSVRTEGWFRLKCTLFALGNLGLDGESEVADQFRNGLLLEGPCLASIFTKPFKVFSAKKFPGVVETTEWSEHLAKQGIKIPIRKLDKGSAGETPDNKRQRTGERAGSAAGETETMDGDSD
jgi:hypothetical protein